LTLNEDLLARLNELVSKDAACNLTSVLSTYCEQVKNIVEANGHGQASAVTSVIASGTSPAAKKPGALLWLFVNCLVFIKCRCKEECLVQAKIVLLYR